MQVEALQPNFVVLDSLDSVLAPVLLAELLLDLLANFGLDVLDGGVGAEAGGAHGVDSTIGTCWCCNPMYLHSPEHPHLH